MLEHFVNEKSYNLMNNITKGINRILTRKDIK